MFDPASETFTFEEGQNGVSVDIDAPHRTGGGSPSKRGSRDRRHSCGRNLLSSFSGRSQSQYEKLGTYSTVSTNTSDGNINMKLALEAVNGTCIPAGDPLIIGRWLEIQRQKKDTKRRMRLSTASLFHPMAAASARRAPRFMEPLFGQLWRLFSARPIRLRRRIAQSARTLLLVIQI